MIHVQLTRRIVKIYNQEELDWQPFISFMQNDMRVEHVEMCECFVVVKTRRESPIV